jgi:hypothetical protein
MTKYNMYNSKLICTYSYYDPILRKHHSDITYDLDDVTGFEDIAEIIYQAELLRVFNIDPIDKSLDDSNEAIKLEITILYKLISSQQKMIECMKTAASLMISDDLELGLMVLYSFDYFFLTHKCVSDFLETGEISEKNMNDLFNEVHKIK